MSSHHVLFIALTACQFLSLSFGQSVSKNVTLTPGNSEQEGARVDILHNDVTINSDNMWYINCQDNLGYHLLLNLDSTSWGFHPNQISEIKLEIHSTDSKEGDKEGLITFSVDANQWITTLLSLDSASFPNDIAPVCNGAFGNGDIKTIVDTFKGSLTFRQRKASNDGSYTQMLPENDPPENQYPLQFTIINDPINDSAQLIFTCPSWNGFKQICTYNAAFTVNKGMQIYIAADDDHEELTFTHFNVQYLYSHLPSTSTEPTTVTPTTTLPTSAEPTTVSPTTVTPTTTLPTSAEPTTSNPTTAELTTVSPSTTLPTASETPTTVTPTTASPTDSVTTPNPTNANTIISSTIYEKQQTVTNVTADNMGEHEYIPRNVTVENNKETDDKMEEQKYNYLLITIIIGLLLFATCIVISILVYRCRKRKLKTLEADVCNNISLNGKSTVHTITEMTSTTNESIPETNSNSNHIHYDNEDIFDTKTNMNVTVGGNENIHEVIEGMSANVLEGKTRNMENEDSEQLYGDHALITPKETIGNEHHNNNNNNNEKTTLTMGDDV